MNKLTALFALLLLAYTAACACPADACNCVYDTRSTEQRVAEAKKAGAVFFYGRVLDIQKKKDDLAVSFAVSEAWSPYISSRASIITAPDSGMCGYEFVKNRDYLVVTYRQDDNELHAYLCSDTQNGFPADFKKSLGPGYFLQAQWGKYGMASCLISLAVLGLCHYKKRHP